MKTYIYLILFLSIKCKDFPKPSKFIRKCLKKFIGKDEVKLLISKYKKYNQKHSKANFALFIYNKRPDVKGSLEYCLKKNNRRLNKEKKIIKKLYLKALVKHKKLIDAMKNEIINGNKEIAVEICRSLINKKKMCKGFVKKYAKILSNNNSKKQNQNLYQNQIQEHIPDPNQIQGQIQNPN